MPRIQPFATELADLLCAVMPAHVSETRTLLIATIDDIVLAEKLRGLLNAGGWDVEITDAGEQQVAFDTVFDGAFKPFRFQIEKPIVEDAEIILRAEQRLFKAINDEPPKAIYVVGAKSSFELFSTVIRPIDAAGETIVFKPVEFLGEPVRYVRDLSPGGKVVPSRLAPWLLKNLDDAPTDDLLFVKWRRRSSVQLLRALCSEVDPDKSLVFKGKSVLRVEAPSEDGLDVSDSAYCELHRLATWVYENPNEIETRHGLALAELVRGANGSLDAKSLVERQFRGVLESVKNAYRLGLHKLNQDALKALSDLRKSVADEVAKLADFTRQTTSSVAGAMFATISVLAARLTLAKDVAAFGPLALFVSIVSFCYVAYTAYQGARFLRIHRELRNEWEPRTKKYLTDEEYQKLVKAPANSAECVYTWSAWLAVLVSLLSVLAVICFAFRPISSSALICPSCGDRGSVEVPAGNEGGLSRSVGAD